MPSCQVRIVSPSFGFLPLVLTVIKMATSEFGCIPAISTPDQSTSPSTSTRKLLPEKRRSLSYGMNGGATTSRRVSMGMREMVTKSFSFLPVMYRISSAHKEFASVRRGTPAPLLRQKKVIDDLLQLATLVSIIYCHDSL